MALSLSDLKKNKLNRASPSSGDAISRKSIAKPWQDISNPSDSNPKPGENPVITEGEPGENPVITEGKLGENRANALHSSDSSMAAPNNDALINLASQQLENLETEPFPLLQPSPSRLTNQEAMVVDAFKPGENPVITEGEPGENPVITEGEPGENPVAIEKQPSENKLKSTENKAFINRDEKQSQETSPSQKDEKINQRKFLREKISPSLSPKNESDKTISQDLYSKELFETQMQDDNLTTASSQPVPAAESAQESIHDYSQTKINAKAMIKKRLGRSQVAVSSDLQPGENPVITRGKPGDNRVITRGKPGESFPQTNLQFQQTRGKPGDKPGDNRVITRGTLSEFSRDFRTLVGNDRTVMLAVFKLAKLNGSRTTSFFSRKALCQEFSLRYETLRSCFKRLRSFGIFEQITSAGGGPAAWVQVTFPEIIYHSLLLSEAQTLVQPGENSVKTRGKLGDQPGETASSSSSLYNNQLITTTGGPEPKPFQLNPEWQVLDLAPLREIHLSISHIQQIAQMGKLQPQEVQDSIHAFAFDLNKNQKAKDLKTSPLNFFIGILRKGLPYIPPENYVSPTDEARRKYLEFKKKQNEQREAMEAEIFELEFRDWYQQLTPELKREIAPYAKIEGSEMQISALREYFRHQVFSKRAAQCISN